MPSGISTPIGMYKARKSINNIDYDIYELEFAPVFDNIGKILAGPVINTAVQYQACCEFVLKALDDMMHEFYSVDQEEVAWAGGSKQYTTSYKIEFTSDMVKLNKRDRINILNSILRVKSQLCQLIFVLSIYRMFAIVLITMKRVFQK